MSPVEKRLLDPGRRRSIPAEGFSWIDRRLVRGGFLERLEPEEILLYLFLVTVGDRDGLSFYGDRTIIKHLGIDERSLDDARRGLARKDLVLYRSPLYQVLSLPPHPIGDRRHEDTEPSSPPPPRRPENAGPDAIGDILDRLL